MKNISLISVAGSALLVFGAATAHAQGSEAEPQVSATALALASAPPSARSIRHANRLLAKDVRRTLVRVKGLDSRSIVVIARGDAVTLGGSVPDASQIELATTAAKGVKGVASVSEKLTVRAQGQ